MAECPFSFVTEDIWEAAKYADLYEKGIAPDTGAALDQCRSFVSAFLAFSNAKAVLRINT